MRERRHDAVDAAHALGDVLPVHQHLVGDDRETKRGDGEVMPARPYGEGGEREAEQAGRAYCRDGGEPEVPAIALDENGGDIGADAEESRLAEVELPGVADHEVERQREQHVHRAQHQDAAPIGSVERPRRRGDDNDRDAEPGSPGGQALNHTFSSLRSAIRPVGRKASMTSSITNTTRSISPEPRYCTVKASMTPTRMPARMVPCMLPKPPMMTMAKALTITDARAKGESNWYGIGPKSASCAFSSSTDTPIVAMRGRSSSPRSRNGANTAAFTASPSSAPAPSAANIDSR